MRRGLPGAFSFRAILVCPAPPGAGRAAFEFRAFRVCRRGQGGQAGGKNSRAMGGNYHQARASDQGSGTDPGEAYRRGARVWHMLHKPLRDYGGDVPHLESLTAG